MRRASFAPAQWAMKFSGRGSSSSVRLSCIPALEPIGSAKARLVEDETANPASTHIATLAEGDEDSFDMDLSTESVEECLGAPSNVDMATRRRQSTGRLSISSVPGDVVKGAVGYAVASVFDPLLLSNILDFISFRELIGNCSLVSQSWHHIAVKLASMVVVSRGCDDGDQGDPDNDVVFKSWPHFVEKFPKGSFLAEGGCKQVFRVWSSIMQRWEAIAVINVAVCIVNIVIGSVTFPSHGPLVVCRPLKTVLLVSSSRGRQNAHICCPISLPNASVPTSLNCFKYSDFVTRQRRDCGVLPRTRNRNAVGHDFATRCVLQFDI